MAGYDTPVEIATAFIEDRPSRKRLSSFFRDTYAGREALLSYGLHYPVLVEDGDGQYLVNAAPSTATTNRHVRSARMALRHAGYTRDQSLEPSTVPYRWEIWTRG